MRDLMLYTKRRESVGPLRWNKHRKCLLFQVFLFCSFPFFLFLSGFCSRQGQDGISDRIWLRAAGGAVPVLEHAREQRPHNTPSNQQPTPENPPLSLSFFFFMAGSWNLDWLGITNHRDKRKIFFFFWVFNTPPCISGDTFWKGLI